MFNFKLIEGDIYVRVCMYSMYVSLCVYILLYCYDEIKCLLYGNVNIYSSSGVRPA